MINKYRFLFGILTLCQVLSLSAEVSSNQQISLEPIKRAEELARHYFVEIEEGGVINKIFDENLYFSFREEYKASGTIKLMLSDVQGNEISYIDVEVNYGMNYYHLDLTTLSVDFLLDKRYILSYGRRKLKFMPVEPLEKPLPVANITVNAVSVDCEDTGIGNLLEFYGQVSSGNAPYNLTWFVFTDSSKEVLLNTPEEQFIEFEEEIGAIVLDNQLSYTVVLTVLDACNQYTEQTLNLVCGNEESDGVTLFLEDTNVPSGGSGGVE
ncbi:MAG: hypothetical protein JXR03_09280 [Cyclobacteriaceae bacterium]